MVRGLVSVRLVGGEAHLGRVPAGDFARLLLGVERAVARAAGHALGRQVKSKGRRERAIAETTRLRLVRVDEGSVISHLMLPEERTTDDEQTLGIHGWDLGERALEDALAALQDEEPKQVDVAEAFVKLADDLGIGTKYDSLTFERVDRATAAPIILNRTKRNRLHAAVVRAERSHAHVLVGVLVEADFERHTARLRTPSGDPVVIRFPSELADEIQEALREQAKFEGEVRYDPKTMQARDVELRRVVRSEQLVLGLDPGDYWTQAPVARLAEERSISPVEDVGALQDVEASPDEIEKLLSALEDM
jgi:hypothetical protein